MEEGHHQQASARAGEHPGVQHGLGDGVEEEEPEGVVLRTAGRQELRDVPDGPDHPDDEAGDQRPVAGLQPGQRVAPPADLLAVGERAPQEEERRGEPQAHAGRHDPGGERVGEVRYRPARKTTYRAIAARSMTAPPSRTTAYHRSPARQIRNRRRRVRTPSRPSVDGGGRESRHHEAVADEDAAGAGGSCTVVQPCESAAAHRSIGQVQREHQHEAAEDLMSLQPAHHRDTARRSVVEDGFTVTQEDRPSQQEGPGPTAGLTLIAGSGQATWVRTWLLIRASIAAIPRSRSGLTACASPSAT